MPRQKHIPVDPAQPPSSPAHKRHDLHFIPLFQRQIVFVGASETTIQLDRNLLGFQLVGFDEGAESLTFRNVPLVTVYSNDHGSIVLDPLRRFPVSRRPGGPGMIVSKLPSR